MGCGNSKRSEQGVADSSVSSGSTEEQGNTKNPLAVGPTAIGSKQSSSSQHPDETPRSPEHDMDLDSISSGGSADPADQDTSPRGGIPTLADDNDSTFWTPTIVALNKHGPQQAWGAAPDDANTIGGPPTTAQLVPTADLGALDKQKDMIYQAMGVDNSTAIVSYSIRVPGANNYQLQGSRGARIPNADDEIGTVGGEKWERIEARRRDRLEKERLRKGLDLAPLRVGSDDPASGSPTPTGTSYTYSPPPLSPLLPPTPHRTKLPKLANTEPYLRFVDVTMMSSQAVNSKGKRIKVLVVSQDEKELAWCTCEDTQLFIAHIPSNRAVGSFVGHSDRILGAALAPVGVSYYVATASVDRFCIIWDRNKGQLNDAKVVIAHTQTVVCVNFSHDFKYIVTACQDKGARIYSARNGECVVVYKGHTEVVFHCGYSPDDQFVSSCSFDLTVHVWSSRNGRPRFVFRGHGKIPMMSSFTPDGKKLLSNDDKEVRVWDIRGNRGCIRIFRVAVCVPVPTPVEGTKAKAYGWTFCSVVPGSWLGTNHFVVGCTNGVVYIYNMNHGLPSVASTATSSDVTNNSFNRATSTESQMARGLSTQSFPGRQGSVVVAGLTKEGNVYSALDEEAALYATKDAEVWSHICKGAVYAIHCGPTSTIACGDLLGNVYIVKLIAG